ncbi:hypothetical protein [Paracerasibacillus soli]|uniref:Uncharacterized protein n=1 Tax=Paracerasibacillus soli TaxID=480284 RepID=A0ABU5CRM9_9BACI|nr:hypothetical protein [Virgibacillus soli]MDY0409026.1 hypothetical protein [Virgibacillus soli]
MDLFIDNLDLPLQLKEYFSKSKVHKKELSEKVLNDIEEFFILYRSLYTFDETEFSANVIITLKKCKDFPHSIII